MTRTFANRAALDHLRLDLDRRPGQHHQERGLRVAGLPVDTLARPSGVHPGPPLLGQDVLHLAPGPDQRLAAERTSARRTTPSCGTAAATGTTRRATTPSTTRTSSPGSRTPAQPFPVPAPIGQHPLLRLRSPADVPASAYTHTNLNSAITDPTRGSGRNTSTTWSASGATPAVTVQHPGQSRNELRQRLHIRDRQDQRPPTGTGPAYMNYDDNPDARGTGSGSAR